METGKKYDCHKCPNGMEFDCEDYTPRQKGVLQRVCIWYTGLVGIDVEGRGRVSMLEVLRDADEIKEMEGRKK